MLKRYSILTVALTVMVAFAPCALAQKTSAGVETSTETAGQLSAHSARAMPSLSDIVGLVEKASGDSDSDMATPIKVAVFFTVLGLLPSLLVMMTSFTRIVIVLGFVRRAMTTQTIPPTIAIVGLALFLTLFTMAPTFTAIRADSIDPYLADDIDLSTAAGNASAHLKAFMMRQTRKADIKLFMELSNTERPDSAAGLPTHVVVPAFIISELRTAFEMGFLIFVPFLVVDLVVASILLSTGMMMLPPVIVSMPFKILLFILVDGWSLLARAVTTSFM